MKRSLAASLSLLLLASATACSTTATITNKDATRAEVRIARSTPTELIVATRDGERVIERDHVQEIDHPGNVAVVAGAALLAAGAANLAGLYRCRENESSDFCVGWAVGGALAGSGLGLLIWGGTVWTNSVEAAGGAPSPVARLGAGRPGLAGAAVSGRHARAFVLNVRPFVVYGRGPDLKRVPQSVK